MSLQDNKSDFLYLDPNNKQNDVDLYLECHCEAFQGGNDGNVRLFIITPARLVEIIADKSQCNVYWTFAPGRETRK